MGEPVESINPTLVAILVPSVMLGGILLLMLVLGCCCGAAETLGADDVAMTVLIA